MELWDVYDMDRIRTDKVLERGETFEKGDYHLVIHICIFNKKGELLIQQRQPFKSGWPNLWDITVGGSAVAGEDSRMAAQRELKEELGIVHDFSGERQKFTINYEQGFDDFYLIEQDVELSELQLQYEEVQAVRWASRDEILEMLRDGTFIPYYESVIQMIFDMRGSMGAHRRARID